MTDEEAFAIENDLPDAIICDIDGTLAHMKDRGPFDWARVGEDVLDDNIAHILYLYQYETSAEIILMSGRDEICRDITEEWLDHNSVDYSTLHMRPKHDNRKDSIVKRELYEQYIKGKYNVLFVLDDRQQVVDMWRDLGLKCLQVAPGDF